LAKLLFLIALVAPSIAAAQEMPPQGCKNAYCPDSGTAFSMATAWKDWYVAYQMAAREAHPELYPPGTPPLVMNVRLYYPSGVSPGEVQGWIVCRLFPTGSCPQETQNFWFHEGQPSRLGSIPQKNIGNVDDCDCSGHEGASKKTGSASLFDSMFVGDPINFSTGNKFEQEDDYLSSGWLSFRRFYNSDTNVVSGTNGWHWRNNYDRALLITGNPASSISAIRPDGLMEVFTKINNEWVGDPSVHDQLVEDDSSRGGYILSVTGVHHHESYNAYGVLQSVADQSGNGITLSYSNSSTPSTVAPTTGLLLSVTDYSGRRLQFIYTSDRQMSNVVLPGGGVLSYTYDASGRLVSVQYPDGSGRQYKYNEESLAGGANLLLAMTGVIDEAGVRYNSTKYNAGGQAISSTLPNGVDAISIDYNSDGTSRIHYTLGIVSTVGLSLVQGALRLVSRDQPCSPQCGSYFKKKIYDKNGYPSSIIDFKGNQRINTFDANGLLIQQIDAQGTANQRKTITSWNVGMRIPLARTELNSSDTPLSAIQWVYNIAGQPLARCELDLSMPSASSYACTDIGIVPVGVRRWTYAYCTAVDSTKCPLPGLLLTVTGPRIDLAQILTYRYYLDDAGSHRHGDLQSITDALGYSITYITYDNDGRVTRTQDGNGVITDFTFAPRGWLMTRIVRANADGSASANDAITTLGYTPYGAINAITDPDGVTVRYTYDDAHRLTDITDTQGNRVHYVLDAAGNKTQEQIFDASGSVRHAISRTFDMLGQLTQITDGLTHAVLNAGYSDSYDANGNLVHSADGEITAVAAGWVAGDLVHALAERVVTVRRHRRAVARRRAQPMPCVVAKVEGLTAHLAVGGVAVGVQQSHGGADAGQLVGARRVTVGPRQQPGPRFRQTIAGGVVGVALHRRAAAIEHAGQTAQGIASEGGGWVCSSCAGY
jgi:YD repeat-containing protein